MPHSSNPLKLQHIELLNALGEQFDIGMGSRSGYTEMTKQLRRIIGFDAVSLWRIDREHQLLVKEAMDVGPGLAFSEADLSVDEKLTYWQMDKRALFFSQRQSGQPRPQPLSNECEWHVVSVPFMSKGDELMGVLNLYTREAEHWCFEEDQEFARSEFFRAVAGQLTVFIYNKALEANRTFYKEIHHRVKNNLQTVASLLRMQIRRLDRVSAERALEESMNRILSIALVHETLSQGEIGMVDLSNLVHRVCAMLTEEQTEKQPVTVYIEDEIMIASREATSLALIVNELVTNAIQHGGVGHISVSVERDGETIGLRVVNQGARLPADFDSERDASLGLTIVSTLATDELGGDFTIDNCAVDGDNGVAAQLRFPLLTTAAAIPDTAGRASGASE